MATMKAVYQEEYGDLSSFKLGQLPKPTPSTGEVLLKVHAAALNPIDVKRGSFTKSGENFPIIVGYDVAGVVEAIGGGDVGGLKVGDRVWGDVMEQSMGKKVTGTLAEYCVVKGKLLAKIPEGSSFTDMAALPVAAMTAIVALEKAGVKKGSKVVVTGGAGGVGVHALSIAKSLYGASEVATTASTKKIDFVKKYGADVVVDYKKEDAGEKLKGYADAVMDCTGEIDMEKKMLKDKNVKISSIVVFGKEGVEGFALTPTRELLEKVNKLIASKKLTPVIDTIYSLDDGLKAVAHIEGGRSKGKVVVKMCD
eukprot:Plantae.Rhodophyta-Hildenbrandia_rubra.ctg7645.p4 GENE.Plantae.Rhodophyta-Hildenbrandia_rubra.ctg7645~~Plantae.Rhodophyta-Hildenbrandia_rubra.ctg7645.p4  ORF type:complete len:310 (+),score=90.21 Plantae.Rhodophyta-Hildenbrandia_rubra.ctg7645:4076-5005(+)